jgi:stage II sporulation protein D
LKHLALVLILGVGCAAPRPAPAARPIEAPPPAAAEAVDAGLPEGELAPRPDDALEALYARQLNFRGGEPQVSVRLMEGQAQATFTARAPMKLQTFGGVGKVLSSPAGVAFTVRVASAEPSQLGYAVQVAELKSEDRAGIAATRAKWEARGYPAKVLNEGAVYGIAGHVLDNRRALILLGPHTTKPIARALQDELGQRFGESSLLHTQLLKRPSGVLEVLDASGNVLAQGNDLLIAEDDPAAGFSVKQVEFAVGYAWHGFQDRTYRGRLLFALDDAGKLAVINALPLEQFLRGLVPSEIPAKAHPEALKAQAITARGEVLAKIGVRHLTDPYLFCAEQHCQVYSGIGGETAATDAAIAATAGEALFQPNGGPLVDTVYSAICGGYTESNEKVWAGPPNPSLRGVPDVIGSGGSGVPVGGLTSENLGAFLADTHATFACRATPFSTPSKFRWTRKFTAAEVDALLARLKVGHVVAMKVSERGVSGRAVALTVSGDTGAGEIRGELEIRRAFKNLPSAMFVLSGEPARGPTGWTFSGGGWGHGVGMCQIGAIGRAEHGEDYRSILRHYFQGSELVKIY